MTIEMVPTDARAHEYQLGNPEAMAAPIMANGTALVTIAPEACIHARDLASVRRYVE